MTAFFKLLQTEIKLSLRDMNMVIFAVLMPLAVLVILGIIYGSQTIGDSSGFLILERSFGALCAISVCAGGLMGLPLLIADYREKKDIETLSCYACASRFTARGGIDGLCAVLRRFPRDACHSRKMYLGRVPSRICRFVFGELASDNGFHIEHRSDGRRYREKLKTGRGDRVSAVFSHADLFRYDSAAGGHAAGHAEYRPFFPADSGDRIHEKRVPRNGDRRSMAARHRYARRNADLFRHFRPLFPMGITN